MADDVLGPERALVFATPAPIPPEVQAAVTRILTGGLSLTEAFTVTVDALASVNPTASRLSVVSTTLRPDQEQGWIRLGDRAWLMERVAEGVIPTAHVGADAGAGRALSLPWFSQQVREHGVVGITDTGLLDGEAEGDRTEIEAGGSYAAVGSSMLCDGTSYGSIGVARAEPGPWPAETLAAVQVLTAALASRMAAERARVSLADAIARGDQARESQQHFFAALGHELRTPISAIIGTAELLADEAADLVEQSDQEGPDRDTVAGFATGVVKDSGVVLSAAEQLLAVIDSLLETGQELGGGTPRQAVSVAEAVSDVVHWLRAPALTAGVTVSFSPDITECVLTTPSGLRQVLANLVGNAIAYNHPGGRVSVVTSASSDDQGIAHVRITVHDTGPGLSPEQQADVFKPFVRFADPEVRGTGLGLALSRSIVERDGGLMGVESTPGEGAAFWVDLPAVVRPQE
ncbi:signal transduction histidine kinase [Nocardioides ginsengisegetis]|uniref:histidine kinase n=1 Tax=Nocardioides ginsengisegetis TaxID=661491 RepID=A0A7W3PA87_9ACTN|nr:signal transduction histidine kinase [Nocardioides ginsengisegetis]